MALPKAILFDLDETLITTNTRPRLAWRESIERHAGDDYAVDLHAAAEAVIHAARHFWSDQDRHREGRLDIPKTMRHIVRSALSETTALDHEVLDRIADDYRAEQVRRTTFFPGVIETLEGLRGRGVKLGLITNGAAEPQRAKVERFGLEPHFDHVQIEGELGVGKPEPAAYHHAVGALGTAIEETWIVGDNLEWEVAVPKSLGFHTIWRDPHDRGLPAHAAAEPHRILVHLPDLLA